MKNSWKIGYYVATYILALIAILGFVYSIVTSRSTSKILKDVQQELESSNKALIRVDKIGWFKEGEISCDNPPVGIFVNCRNFSNVPIQVYKTDVNFFYGTKELDDSTRTIGNAESSILPPGETYKVGTVQKELFQKYLG